MKFFNECYVGLIWVECVINCLIVFFCGVFFYEEFGFWGVSYGVIFCDCGVVRCVWCGGCVLVFEEGVEFWL